ncbi:unnamed protein product [Leptidea sinapis]|uniref:Sodium channel protein Nach n=1 Tax=Leptidea sinapis TaxID=189913 RepID=A0A5E4PPT1_9NEOP|nr:unnamed protein product [Leptidea sinapis]
MTAVTILAYVLVYLLYTRFDDMPTRIAIENQYEVANNLPYPSIAICTPNQLTISSMNHFNRTLVNIRKTNITIHKAKKPGPHNGLTVVSDYNPEDAIDGTIVNAGAIREPLRYFNEYHNSDCDLLCHVKRVEKHCGCIMMYIPHVKMSQICDISDIKCIIEVKLQSTEEYRRSECNCPRDCVSYRYRVNMILGNLDALPYQIRNPYGNMTFNKSSSIMHFFMPKSVYVIQKQETVMSLINFFANLGGVFGLCLGCSVITIFEIFFYIHLAFKQKRKNKVHNPRPEKYPSGHYIE